MSDSPTQPQGWYYAQGDPPGTQRYWDGTQWQGGPQPVPGAVPGGGVGVAGGAGALAEPLNRIGARIIDYILWIIVSVVLGLIFGAGAIAAGNTEISYVASLLSGVISLALIAGYEIFMVGTRGATLGKMLLGIKVVRADGSSATMQDAAMRMAPYIALSLAGAIVPFLGIITGLVLIVIGIVSLVFLFTDGMRQTVWDKVAKTIVVTGK